jgi:hypothetical protein
MLISRIYQDLVNYVDGKGGSIVGVNANPPIHNEYIDWLEEITFGFSKFPSLIPIEKYFYFLEAFKIATPSYNFPTNSNLYPDALMNLIKSSPCAK